MDSDCMMVRYQAEIEKFRQTYKDTMALVPERYMPKKSSSYEEIKRDQT